jgi:putative holliday junction resolvase
MSRILSLDYGSKRVGIAVTDPEQIIATGLTTVPAKDIFDFLTRYMAKEPVESFVVGEPKHLDNTPSQSAEQTNTFIDKLKKLFPAITVYKVDERFTSRMASRTMIDGGMKKMKRRDKAMIDKISATIILQTFMEMKRNSE